MGGGQQAQEPTLNVGQSLKLSQGQIDQLKANAPDIARILGDTSRTQDAANTLFGLGMLTDPAGTLYGNITADADAAKKEATKALDKEVAAFKKKPGNKKKPFPDYDKRLAEINATYDRAIAPTKLGDPVKRLTDSFKDEFAQRDAFIGQAQATLPSTAEYNRLQAALGQGTTAETIGARTSAAEQATRTTGVTAPNLRDFGSAVSTNITADRLGRTRGITAPTLGEFGRANATNISAGQVGAGALGDSLMARAQRGVALGGRLGAEAERDAVQAARAGMAARGLATGNASVAAELLNRDRYARQREFEDLQFADRVQSADQARQFQNVGNRLTADQANQQAALQTELANLRTRYEAAVQQGNWQQAAALANQADQTSRDVQNVGNRLQAAQANQQAALQAETANLQARYNAAVQQGNWQQAAALANQADQTNRDIVNVGQQNDMARFNANQQSAADVFNANALYGNQLNNMQFLGQSAQLADADRARQLATQQDIYNFSMSSNPRMMLAGVGSPYANMTQPALGQLGAITGNAQPVYTGGQFSSGNNGALGGAIGTVAGVGLAGLGLALAPATGGTSLIAAAPLLAAGGSLGGAVGTGIGSSF
jgi:hypothetical protein